MTTNIFLSSIDKNWDLIRLCARQVQASVGGRLPVAAKSVCSFPSARLTGTYANAYLTSVNLSHDMSDTGYPRLEWKPAKYVDATRLEG